MATSPLSITNYTMYSSAQNSLLIHKSGHHSFIKVVAPFSVFAAKVFLNRTVTIASIYISPATV